MNGVNKTLYIPLYGKALVSQRGLFLQDAQAQRIWEQAGICLHGKAASKWLAYNMGMRGAVFDQWVAEKLEEMPGAVALHLGCGLDSRENRVGHAGHLWFDVDFPEVMAQRRRFFQESQVYRMLDGDICRRDWLEQIPKNVPAVIVMEGVSMYLPPEGLKQAMLWWSSHFSQVSLLMDSYTLFAAKVSRYKNPVNQMGVTRLYGLDDPQVLAQETGFAFLAERELTPGPLIAQLPKQEQWFFRTLFAGSWAKKIYRLYEYETT